MWYKEPFLPLEVRLKAQSLCLFICFLLLVPLAITSTKGMVKRLGGRRWAQLHRVVYATAIGGVIHYYLIVKSDTRWPIAFGVALALLLGFRMYQANREAANPAKLAP